MVVIDEQGARFRAGRRARNGGALCIFEFIYFARPDSVIEGQALHDVRARMGEPLADEAPVDADVVIARARLGHPGRRSATPSGSGIPYSEGLIKNRYIGRTFIQPDQEMRELGVRLKFNPLPNRARRPARRDGRRLDRARHDDAQLVQLLREAGRARCTCASPRRRSCALLLRHRHGRPGRADRGRLAPSRRCGERLGADSLAYLSLDGLVAATGQPAEGFCTACLTGHYPTEIPADMRLSKLRFEAQPVESR